MVGKRSILRMDEDMSMSMAVGTGWLSYLQLLT